MMVYVGCSLCRKRRQSESEPSLVLRFWDYILIKLIYQDKESKRHRLFVLDKYIKYFRKEAGNYLIYRLYNYSINLPNNKFENSCNLTYYSDLIIGNIKICYVKYGNLPIQFTPLDCCCFTSYFFNHLTQRKVLVILYTDN